MYINILEDDYRAPIMSECRRCSCLQWKEQTQETHIKEKPYT